jgi:multiple sugar transport system permease protein
MEVTSAAAASRRAWRRRVRVLRQNLAGYGFIAPWLFGLLAFRVYPLVASFFFSLTRYNVLNPPVWVGGENYVAMMTKDPVYWKSVSNTIYYVGLSVPLGLMSSLILAMLLNQSISGIGVYRTIYYLPSIVPPVAGTLIWVVILNPTDGLLNTVLRGLGVARPPGWFVSATWSKPGLILLSLWGAGRSTLVFLAGLKDISQSLYDAAKIDGANAWGRFWLVTLPLLTPVILFNLIMSIIGSFGVFTTAVVAGSSPGGGGGQGTGGITAGGPLDSMLMYMMLLYRHAFRYFAMGQASAMAVTMFLVILALTLFILATSGRWVYYEAASRR